MTTKTWYIPTISLDQPTTSFRHLFQFYSPFKLRRLRANMSLLTLNWQNPLTTSYNTSSSAKFFRQGGNAWNLFDFDNQSAATFCWRHHKILFHSNRSNSAEWSLHTPSVYFSGGSCSSELGPKTMDLGWFLVRNDDVPRNWQRGQSNYDSEKYGKLLQKALGKLRGASWGVNRGVFDRPDCRVKCVFPA